MGDILRYYSHSGKVKAVSKMCIRDRLEPVILLNLLWMLRRFMSSTKRPSLLLSLIHIYLSEDQQGG